MTFEPAKALVDRVVTLARTFDAPRKVVFEAWTDPYHVAKWWGPTGFTNPVCEWDARPGGAIRIEMRAPDGTLYPMRGEIREIVSPETLIFTSAVDDAQSNTILEVLHTVTFAEREGKTTVTVDSHVTKAMPEAEPMLDGMEDGWSQSLERLAALVSPV